MCEGVHACARCAIDSSALANAAKSIRETQYCCIVSNVSSVSANGK